MCSRVPRAVCGSYEGAVVDPYSLAAPEPERCFYDEACDGPEHADHQGGLGCNAGGMVRLRALGLLARVGEP